MEFHPTLVNCILVLLVTFSGTVLQGSIGFGLGPIAVPFLALLSTDFIPGPLLLAALVLTLLLSFRERESVHTTGVIWAVPGRTLGSLLGALLLILTPRDKLSLLFGGMVLLAVFIIISGIKPRLTPAAILSGAVLSGLMGTTAAIGGAPMGLVYQGQEGPRIRGTLSVIFAIGTIISLCTLLAIGRFGAQELILSSLLLPGIILGFLLSHFTAPLLDRGLIRPAILLVSGLAGAAVILLNLI